MARKRKSRNNSKIGHGAISRIGRPNNPFEPRRNRYAQKYLTLALMGGAAFFVLKGVAIVAMSITTATERFTRQCRIVLMTVIMPTFARVAGTTPKRHFMPMFRRI